MVKAFLVSHVMKQDERMFLEKKFLGLVMKLLVNPEDACVEYAPYVCISVTFGGLAS